MRKPPPPKKPTAPGKNLLARSLASHVRNAHGVGAAFTLDSSGEAGDPKGYVGVANIALQRALGTVGIPLGRVTEISGWAGAGKSTMLDQLLAQTQVEGGIAVLADTERGRNRAYMAALGIDPASLVWIGGRTVEAMFDEVETLARTAAHYNAVAWYEALISAGAKVPALTTYRYMVFDPADGGKKPVASYDFASWSRAQAAALLQWQGREGLSESGIRDKESRAKLRPVIIHTDDKDRRKEAIAAWRSGNEDPLCQAADRPIVIGWDSVAGTATEAELEGNARDVHPAAAARVIRRNLRRLVQLIDDEAIAMILVNQRYEKLQMGGGRQWGPTSETYGGGGIKYHTTIRVELTKVGSIFAPGQPKAGGFPPVGQEVLIKVPKNKVADPYRSERYGLIFGHGANDGWAIYEDLKSRGIIRVGGGWSKFTDPTILGGEDASFRGWRDLSDMLVADSKLRQAIEEIYLEGR